MNNKYLIICLLIQCLSLSSNSLLSDGVGSSRLMKNALEGWQKIEDNATKRTYVFETVRDDGIEHDPAKNDYARWKVEASFLGNNILFHSIFDRGDGTAHDFVACKNGDYVFRVLRADKNSSWQMDDLLVPESGDQMDDFTTEDLEVVLSPWSILKMPLRVVVNDPTFKLITESEQDETNNEYASFSFELNSTNSTYELMTQLKQCKVVLDPKHDYAVVKYEAEFDNQDGKSRFKGIGKCIYDFDSGFPALKSYRYTLLRGGGTQKEITWMTTFSKIEPCVLAPKDFRLSAYGFSEPEEPGRQIGIVNIVLMIASIVLIILGLYWRWFAMKKS